MENRKIRRMERSDENRWEYMNYLHQYFHNHVKNIAKIWKNREIILSRYLKHNYIVYSIDLIFIFFMARFMKSLFIIIFYATFSRIQIFMMITLFVITRRIFFFSEFHCIFSYISEKWKRSLSVSVQNSLIIIISTRKSLKILKSSRWYFKKRIIWLDINRTNLVTII